MDIPSIAQISKFIFENPYLLKYSGKLIYNVNKIIKHSCNKNLKYIHNIFFHKLSSVTAHAEESGGLSGKIDDLADSIRRTSENILGLSDGSLYCTIKVITDIEQKGLSAVTIGRSKGLNCYGRGVPLTESKLEDAQLVSANTSFLSLIPSKNRANGWENPMCAFVSNDINSRTDTSQGNTYLYSRPTRPFKSTICIPIVSNSGEEQRKVEGVLTLDSPDKNTFIMFPETFDYNDRAAVFREMLNKIPAFHALSIMAHSLLSLSLQERKRLNEENFGQKHTEHLSYDRTGEPLRT